MCIYIYKKMKPEQSPQQKMKQDFFKHLPSEIIINIFSRLPIRTILQSKCVSKPWLHLLQSNHFVTSHFSKSVPGLVVVTTTRDPSSCTIFEFEDGQHELGSHELRYNQLTEFDFPHPVDIRGSANGLLFLGKLGEPEAHFLCNPITRDYIEIHFTRELIRQYPPVLNFPEIIEENVYSYPHSVTYGFGASKISEQFKVVRIFHDSVIVHGGGGGLPRRRIIPKPECHVYTVGTGSWRAVEHGAAAFEYSCRTSCVFLNGNLHWIASDSDEKQWISCFDLEREDFSHFSTPPIFQEDLLISGLSALGDWLCVCDHTQEVETVIWLMKEYGEEKSWTKVFVFNVDPELDIEGWELLYPIKVFEDGDVLILREDRKLFYYSSKTEITRGIDIFREEGCFNSILLTPSFLSLKSFLIENVVSF